MIARYGCLTHDTACDPRGCLLGRDLQKSNPLHDQRLAARPARFCMSREKAWNATGHPCLVELVKTSRGLAYIPQFRGRLAPPPSPSMVHQRGKSTLLRVAVFMKL